MAVLRASSSVYGYWGRVSVKQHHEITTLGLLDQVEMFHVEIEHYPIRKNVGKVSKQTEWGQTIQRA